MGNGMSIHPADLMFDYRSISGRFNRKGDKLIGFCCSLSVHICMLTIAGVVFIKPVEFGVDLGLSSMEVQLVAGSDETVTTPEVVKEETVVVPQEPPVIEEKIKDPQKLPKEDSAKNYNLGNSTINASSLEQGAVSEAKPDYFKNPAPRYPLEARQKSWEGLVVLKAVVGKSGYPLSVEIEKSSGHEVLDEAAFRTVKTWKFHPAQLGNIPIESSVRVPVRFKLDKLIQK